MMRIFEGVKGGLVYVYEWVFVHCDGRLGKRGGI